MVPVAIPQIRFRVNGELVAIHPPSASTLNGHSMRSSSVLSDEDDPTFEDGGDPALENEDEAFESESDIVHHGRLKPSGEADPIAEADADPNEEGPQSTDDLLARVERELEHGDEESEDAPDWMFDEGEVRSADATYQFCPAPHRRQILHLFTVHFCLHPLFPERDGTYTKKQIRDRAVYEMYMFCWQRGLAEVWGYLWTSWYQPSRWKLWARSTSPYVSRLRTTMTVENHWRQLKHKHLHHLVRPRLDQLTWILITEVTPAYLARSNIMEDTHRLGRGKSLSPYQRAFKTSWKLLRRLAVSSRTYTVNIPSWTCNCGAQKIHPHHLCKHLVQAVGQNMPVRFWREVYRRRSLPLYQHPALTSPHAGNRNFHTDPDKGSITEGDDHVYLGDEAILQNREWRDLEGGLVENTRKRPRSGSTSSVDTELGATTEEEAEVQAQLQSLPSGAILERGAPHSPADHNTDSEEENEVRLSMSF